MIAVPSHHSRLFQNNWSSWLIVLLSQTDSIISLAILLAMLRVFSPSLNTSFTLWQWQNINDGSQNIASIREIASMMETSLRSGSSNYHHLFSLTGVGQSHSAKLRSIFSWAWLSENGQKLINAISIICLQLVLLVNEPRGRNEQRSSAELAE